SHQKTNRRPGAHRAFPYPVEPPRSLADRNPNLLLDRHYQAPRNDTRGLRSSTMAADSAAHPAFANFGVVGSNSPCITRLGTSLTTGVFEFSLASDPIQVAQTCQSSRSPRRVPAGSPRAGSVAGTTSSLRGSDTRWWTSRSAARIAAVFFETARPDSVASLSAREAAAALVTEDLSSS